MLQDSSAFDPVPISSMRAAPWDLKETTPAPVARKMEDSLEPLPWDNVDDNFLASDADDFLKDFDFPADSSAFEDIEDDNVFGNLLEEIVGL